MKLYDKFLITGEAGSGKNFFVKYNWKDIIEEQGKEIWDETIELKKVFVRPEYHGCYFF